MNYKNEHCFAFGEPKVELNYIQELYAVSGNSC